MLGIKQSRDHVTNQSMYQPTGQVPIRERQIKFTGHCILMPTDEGEIRKMAVNKSEWSQLFVVPKNKKPPDQFSKLVR